MREALKKLLLFLVTFGAILPIYFGIAEYTLDRSTKSSFLLPIDEAIPLVPEAIFAYMSFHLFCFSPVFFKSISLLRYMETVLAMLGAFGFMFLCYLVIPSAYPRPLITDCDCLSHILLARYYAADPPNNTFPSSHVAATTIILLEIVPKLRKFSWIFGIWGASIILSTLLVKQHYVVDVITGLTLGLASVFAARVMLKTMPRGAN